MAKTAAKLSGIIDITDCANLSANELGGKGFRLVDMTSAGLKVPPARVICTDWCREYMKNPTPVMALAQEQLAEALSGVSGGLKFPLISVRSGAKVSMPGMMDTILNVGMTKDAIPFWEKRIGPRAARDSRRRLMQMYGSVVFGIEGEAFSVELEKIKTKRRAKEDADLDEVGMSEVIAAYDGVFLKHRKKLPETLQEQTLGAIEAVFGSWNNERAKTYRKIHAIPDEMGTAVVLQKMVFGNLNDSSCTGVLFSRNPATGRDSVMGEFLINAQGEDVVAGVRTPLSILDMEEWNRPVYDELMDAAKTMEKKYRDVQDIEFTVEDGQLYFLQSRDAKRSALAELKIAMDLSRSGLISKGEALDRLSLAQYETLCAPMIAPGYMVKPDVEGLPASTGIVTGKAVFSSEAAVDSDGDVILIARETTPEDLPGMHASIGILTATGGVTSHAAVVARGMDKVCIVGAPGIVFQKNKNGDVVSATLGNSKVNEGDILTMDGASGRVWVGTSVPVVSGGSLQELLDLHDMIFELYPVYRVTTDGRDLHEDFKMIFATYALDGLSKNKLRDEIQESLPFLNGILDLSTANEHASADDKQILALGGGGWDDEIFAQKAEAALSYSGKKNFSVYLGEREADWRVKFEREGYDIAASGAQKSKAVQGIALRIQDSLTQSELTELAKKPGQVCATAAVEPEHLLSLRERKSNGDLVEPYLALSAQQLLASVLRPK